MAYQITDRCIGCSLCKKVCPVDAIQGDKGKVHNILGPICIDCGACGKVCPKSAVNDSKGQKCERIRFKSRWEKPAFILQKCIGCTICIEACPVGCLSLSATAGNLETIRYPYLNNSKTCISCGFCVLECPVDAVEMVISGPVEGVGRNQVPGP